MCLYVLYLNVIYRHIHANMNLLVSYICLYLIVSACMWKQIWNCIHAHMIWYRNSIVCICLYFSMTYSYIWLDMKLISACIWLYLPVSACMFCCICLYQLINVRGREFAARTRRAAAVPLHVRRAGRIYAGRLPFLFGLGPLDWTAPSQRQPVAKGAALWSALALLVASGLRGSKCAFKRRSNNNNE